MRRPVLSSAVLALVIGCGGGSSTDDIARNLDEVIDTTATAGRVSEPEAESAAKRMICQALGGYSSEPAGLATDTLERYAAQQQLSASLNLQSTDPTLADRLADAAAAIDTSQDAAEVADNLAC